MTSQAIQGVIRHAHAVPRQWRDRLSRPGAVIEWYIAHGSGALFAVCQSSEMMFLSLEERVALGRFVVEKAAGRLPSWYRPYQR